jgi:hypothetical protein
VFPALPSNFQAHGRRVGEDRGEVTGAGGRLCSRCQGPSANDEDFLGRRCAGGFAEGRWAEFLLKVKEDENSIKMGFHRDLWDTIHSYSWDTIPYYVVQIFMGFHGGFHSILA